MRDNPDYFSQKKTLPQLKKSHPWYKEIYSQVLQDVVKRVKVTFDRFLKGDSNGKRSGRPRFKSRDRYKTFTYPQMKEGCLQGNLINLPMFGKVNVILHRPIPDGFKVKVDVVAPELLWLAVSLGLPILFLNYHIPIATRARVTAKESTRTVVSLLPYFSYFSYFLRKSSLS